MRRRLNPVVLAVAALLAVLGLLYWLGQRPAGGPSAAEPSPTAPAPADGAGAELRALESDAPRDAAAEARGPGSPLTDEDAQASAAGEPPPGLGGETCLSIHASWSGAPLVGSLVRVVPGDGGPLRHDFGALSNELRRATLAGDGAALLCGVPDETLMVGVEVGGQWYGQFADAELNTTTEVELELGSAVLHGSIYTEQREPAGGALVRVAHRGSGVTCGVLSSEDGSYRIERLAPGPYWLSVMLDGDRWSDGDYYLQPIFEAGEVRRQDFGPGPDSGQLAGALLDRAGHRVELFGRSTATLSFIHTATSDQRSVRVESDGSFEIALEAGTYRVRAEHNGHWESVLLEEAFEVPASGLERDFVLPGVTVRGSLTGPATGDAQGARAHPVGELAPSVFRRAECGDGRTYAFYGLAPGRWRLGAYGQPLEDFTELEIRPSDTVLELDLTQG